MENIRSRFSKTLASSLWVVLHLILGASMVSAQVNKCVEAPDGLVSWWPGDGNAADIVDGNPGTLQNGATFAAGVVGQSFILDGTDDFVLVSPAANLDITGDVTVDLWARRTTFGPPATLVSQGAGFIPFDAPSVYLLRFVNDRL